MDTPSKFNPQQTENSPTHKTSGDPMVRDDETHAAKEKERVTTPAALVSAPPPTSTTIDDSSGGLASPSHVTFDEAVSSPPVKDGLSTAEEPNRQSLEATTGSAVPKPVRKRTNSWEVSLILAYYMLPSVRSIFPVCFL